MRLWKGGRSFWIYAAIGRERKRERVVVISSYKKVGEKKEGAQGRMRVGLSLE